MKIRRFVAKDMRTALAQIKDELGVDAVIMSNKKIPEGVELMAAVDYNQVVAPAQPPASIRQKTPVAVNASNTRQVSDDVVSFGQKIPDQNNVPSTTSSKPAPADSLSALLNRQVQQPTPQYSEGKSPENLDEGSIEQQLKDFTARLSQPAQEVNIASSQPQPSQVNADDGNDNITANVSTHLKTSTPLAIDENYDGKVSSQDFSQMQQEMASIRSLLEHQVSGLMWQDMAQKDPQRAVLVNRLLSLGLNEQIADQIAGYVPEKSHEKEAWSQAIQLIAKQINTTQNDIINRGGVVALVGPTGVGKTTTIAKLAAGFAQVHGRDQVALISTDTFRISGFEQLATYGKIIGCQVGLAKDSQALDALLQQYSKKKLILIDTAGMGQRDMRLAEHLTTLISNARVKIRNYLVLAANSQQGVMQENVDRFKKVPLSGCIFTKLDESISIGEIITTSIQNGLPIGYLTDGQRVPEDIKVANAEKLVTLADNMATKYVNNNASLLRPVSVASASIA
ncbi:MAG: flagellar biosynthesis protein FlhF [Colwellia sp.]